MQRGFLAAYTGLQPDPYGSIHAEYHKFASLMMSIGDESKRFYVEESQLRIFFDIDSWFVHFDDSWNQQSLTSGDDLPYQSDHTIFIRLLRNIHGRECFLIYAWNQAGPKCFFKPDFWTIFSPRITPEKAYLVLFILYHDRPCCWLVLRAFSYCAPSACWNSDPEILNCPSHLQMLIIVIRWNICFMR